MSKVIAQRTWLDKKGEGTAFVASLYDVEDGYAKLELYDGESHKAGLYFWGMGDDKQKAEALNQLQKVIDECERLKFAITFAKDDDGVNS